MTMTSTTEKDFTKAPNALFQLYTRLPGFKQQHMALWIVLRNYHNGDYGYAFPSQDQLADDMGVNRQAIKRQLGILEKYDLIQVISRRKGSGENDRYVVKMPIADRSEFLSVYPEAAEVFKVQTEHKERRRAERDAGIAKSSRRTEAEDIHVTVGEEAELKWI